jgi:hypothetical protein
VRWVGLIQVECDHTIGMAGRDSRLIAREQVEGRGPEGRR